MTSEDHIVEGLSGGNLADISEAEELTAEIYGCYALEDKDYDGNEHRESLISRRNIPVIPGRKNRKIKIIYDKTIYKLRDLST